jgi:cob(I)alamin adenosyltransferase
VSIATRRGDDGTTGLLGGGRVPKDHPRIEALGAFDELNVEVGAARMLAGDEEARELLLAVQSSLVAVMGEIAGTGEEAAAKGRRRYARLAPEDLGRLDRALEALESRSPRLEGWATPGGTPEALALDRARVAARRAERRLAAKEAAAAVRPLLLQWTNRLSDVLFIMARAAESRD